MKYNKEIEMYQKSEILEKLMKKYKLEEGMRMTFKLLEKITYKDNIEIKDLLCIFQISEQTYYGLKTQRHKYTILKFNKFERRVDKKIINKGEISKLQYNEIKKEINVKDGTLIRSLGVSRYKYNKMKNAEIEKIKIIDIEIKHIVDLIKIDLKYIKKYGNRYYLCNELEEICNKREITLMQFIKYYGKNDRHYKFNIIAMERSEKGLWIGENEKISNSFMEEYNNKIQQTLERAANKASELVRCENYKEDMVSEAKLEIYQNYGNIVKKFYFDTKIMFNILKIKAKYIMVNVYRKKYKDVTYLHYDGYENIYADDNNDLQKIFGI